MTSLHQRLLTVLSILLPLSESIVPSSATASANVDAVNAATEKRLALEQRANQIRHRMEALQRNEASAKSPPMIAQWYNWPNWPNWPNGWRNW